MNKQKTRWIIILAVLAIVYTVIIFAAPFKIGATLFICYIAELLAIGLQYPLYHIAFESDTTVKSKFYGFPLIHVGYTYLVAQTIAGLALTTLATNIVGFPTWVSIVVSVIIIAIGLIGSIAVDTAREAVMQVEEQTKIDTAFIKKMRVKSQNLVNQTNDVNLKKQLQGIAEKFQYSDPVSNANTAECEKKIEVAFEFLEQRVKSNDTSAISFCNDILNLLDERNAICKSNKGA